MANELRWTLTRNETGRFELDYHNGVRHVLVTPGELLSIAWALKMPAPATAADVSRIVADPERFEIEAIEYLTTCIEEGRNEFPNG